MSPVGVTQDNVGRIAERIVANELEFRGFRLSDLNRDGTSANADLLAVCGKRTSQIQVKGATNTDKDKGWWVQYGHCNEAIIAGKEPMFNRISSFYKADVVVLVAVKSPKEYAYVVLPVEAAERAAQINFPFRPMAGRGALKGGNGPWTLNPGTGVRIAPRQPVL